MSYAIKAGNLEPPLEATLYRSAGGEPLDLSTAESITARVRRHGDAGTLLEKEAMVADAEGGIVSMTWSPGETDEPGLYEAEFVVMWPGGRPQTVPTRGFKPFRIYEDATS